MNKIIVENDNKISFDNEVIDLNIKVSNLTIDIKNNVVINNIVCENQDLDITLNIKKNSSLTFNKFFTNKKITLKMLVNIEDNSSFNGNLAFIITDVSFIDIDTKMLGSNINNDLKIKCLTKENGQATIRVDGNVLPKTINNVMKEDIRLLNQNDSYNKIWPNMLVATNEVQADHFVTISSIDPQELFYLNSKGIDKNLAIEILEKGFIYEILSKDVQKLIEERR